MRTLLAANLIGHWVANDLAATLADTDNVATWVDRVSSIPATALGTPKLSVDSLDGQSSVRFARSDGSDSLVVAAADNPIAGQTDFSVAVVFRTATESLNGGRSAWFLNTGLVDATGFFGTTADWGVVLTSAGEVGAGLGGPAQTLYSTASGLNDGEAHAVIYRVSEGTLSLSVDGGPEEVLAGGSTAPRVATEITFGAITRDSFGFSGDIAEVRLYDDDLSEAETAALSKLLLERYRFVPVITRDDSYQASEDTLLVVDAASGILANDENPEPVPVRAAVVTPPEHGTINLNEDGSFVYSPDPQYFGPDSFSYLVRNGLESATATVSFDVASQFDEVVGLPDRYVVDAGQALQITAERGVLANDINLDQSLLEAVLHRDVEAGQLTLRSDGSFDYAPGDFTGTTTFEYRPRDAGGVQDVVTVTLKVNQAPTSTPDAYQTTEDVPLFVPAATGVLASDQDLDADPLSARLITPPAHGTLLLLQDGSFTYAPDPEFHGTDTFQYRANDGDDDSPPADVEISVQPVNDPPLAKGDSYFGRPNEAVVISAADGVLANDQDPDGDPLSVSLATGPGSGTVELMADGAFRYQPFADSVGTDQFTYRALDGQGVEALATVTLHRHADHIVISEFVASNQHGLRDYDDRTSDWFEVHNRDTHPVDLQGWYVTDDASDLTKWQFSGSTPLAPDGHLVVFASGRDGQTPNGEWHTSFRLTDRGEYFALVRPDGETIAWDVAPSFPAQFPDVAFGGGPVEEQVDLLTPNATAAVHVPEDGTLGQQWTQIHFDDSAWSSASTGIGYAEGVEPGTLPGFSTRMIQVRDTMIQDPFQAESLLQGTGVAMRKNLVNDATTFVSNINFGGAAGSFADSQPYPDGTNDSRLSDFAISATARVRIPVGQWTIAVGSDEAALLRLTGASFRNVVDGDPASDPQNGLLVTQPRRGHGWTLATITGTNQTATLELIAYDRRGTDSLELAIIDEFTDGPVDSDTWTLLEDGALGWSVTTEFGLRLPEFAPLVRSSLTEELAGKQSSVYVRIPFEVTDKASIDRLLLQMQYDDAFVAYLNGVEVARRNLEGPPTWDSVSAAHRPDIDATQREDIDLGSFRHLLREGNNVLALHGVNASRFDNGLLLLPTLSAVAERDAGSGYLATPTPGETNGVVATGAVAAPQFSLAGGLFQGTREVRLSTATPGAQIHFSLDGTPPSLDSPRYVDPIQLDASTEVRARAFQANHAPSEIRSEVYIRLADDLLDFRSDLPLMVVDTLGNAIPGTGAIEKAPAAAALFSPGINGHSDLVGTADSVHRAAIKIRGSSSSGQAKRPYSFEFRADDTDGNLDVAPFGLPPESDWVLFGQNGFDRSLTRNSFIYDLSNQIGEYATRTQYIELFVNQNGDDLTASDYFGVYKLTERIDRSPDRVDVERLSPQYTTEPEISGGYILKIDRADPGDNGFAVEVGRLDVEDPVSRTILYVDPKESEIEVRDDQPEERPEQAAYIQNYFNEFNAALYSPGFTHPELGHYSDYIDVDSWIDQQLLNELAWNVDAFALSGYFHKPRDGKLAPGPIWDFDRSMESTDGRDNNPESWLGSRRFFLWFGRLFEDPVFYQQYIDRWQQLRSGAFSNENISATLDRQASQIEQAMVRDNERWGFGYRNSDVTPLDGTWQGEVEHQRAWLNTRLAWLDSRFVAPPQLSTDGPTIPQAGEVDVTVAAGATVYYTLDGTDPRLPDGSIAPQAHQLNGSIPVSDGIQIVARAFNPNHDGDAGEETKRPFLPERTSVNGDPIPATVAAWSGPVRATFAAHTARDSLRISEVHYHPAAVNAGESLAGFEESDFEFIELVNRGNGPIDLSHVALQQITVGNNTQGVGFEFASGNTTRLNAGETVLVVANEAAFAHRYGGGHSVAGAFSGGLSNNRELLTLTDDEGTIQQFTYDDDWHPTTDGLGFSLEVVDPASPDLTRWQVAAGWQPSGRVHGSPGETPLGKRGDFDGDGLVGTADIDALFAAVNAESHDPAFDLTSDGMVDRSDLDELILNILDTQYGDANLDGRVDADEGMQVLTNLGGGSGFGWADGDFDGDGRVTASGDLAVLLAALAADQARASDQQPLTQPAVSQPSGVSDDDGMVNRKRKSSPFLSPEWGIGLE